MSMRRIGPEIALVCTLGVACGGKQSDGHGNYVDAQGARSAMSVGGGTTTDGPAWSFGGNAEVGGAPGASGAAAGGGNGTGGCGLLIDDMEARSGYICEDAGRKGAWYSYNDQSKDSEQWPPPAMEAGVPIAVSTSDRTGNGHAMRTYGYGYTEWGAGIGFDLNYDYRATPHVYGTFDASDYDGISFWHKGSGFSFRVNTVKGTLAKYGGACAAENDVCDDLPHQRDFYSTSEWKLESVKFADLWSPEPYGTFERHALTNVQFQSFLGSSATETFDFSIDDVAFFVSPECCEGSMPRCQTLPIVDPNVDSALRERSARASGALRCKDLCNTSKLEVGQVSSLAGLECLPQITSVTASSGALADLGPLAALSSLRSLNLRNNQISDIAPLAGLTALVSLDLYGNAVVSLEPLRLLKNLQSLTVTLGEADDIVVPGSLDSLTRLTIYGGKIRRLELEAGLPKLQEVSISNSTLSELVIPQDLPALKRISATDAQLQTLTLGSGLVALESILVPRSQLQALTLPQGMANLVVLSVSDNTRLTTLDLAPDSALKELYASKTKLGLGALTNGLQNLTALDISSTNITELSFPSAMTQITNLKISSNAVSDLSPVVRFTALKVLYASNNQITDLSPLVQAGLPVSGGTLDVSSNPLDCPTQKVNIDALKARNVSVSSDCLK